jgi:hypothetical protein
VPQAARQTTSCAFTAARRAPDHLGWVLAGLRFTMLAVSG